MNTHIDSEKQGSFSSAKVSSNGSTDAAKSYPYLPPHQYQKQFQQHMENSGREEAAEKVADREIIFSAQPVCFLEGSVAYPFICCCLGVHLVLPLNFRVLLPQEMLMHGNGS